MRYFISAIHPNGEKILVGQECTTEGWPTSHHAAAYAVSLLPAHLYGRNALPYLILGINGDEVELVPRCIWENN